MVFGYRTKRSNNSNETANHPIDLDVFLTHQQPENFRITVLASPADEISTIAVDTIGNTVLPCDFEHPRHIAGTGSFAESNICDTKLPIIDYGCEDTVDDQDQSTTDGTFGGNTTLHHEGHASLSSKYDGTNSLTSKRLRRTYIFVGVIGLLIGSIIFGTVLIIIFRNKDDGRIVEGSSFEDSRHSEPTGSPSSSNFVPTEDIVPSDQLTLSPLQDENDPDGSIVTSTTRTPNTPSASPSSLPSRVSSTSATYQPSTAFHSHHVTTTSPSSPKTSFLPLGYSEYEKQVEHFVPSEFTTDEHQMDFISLLQSVTASADYWQPLVQSQNTSSSFTSAQWKALDWLLSDPNYWFLSDERRLQRYALAVLAFGTMNTDSSPMPSPSSVLPPYWLDYNVHECYWWTQISSGNACIFDIVDEHPHQRGLFKRLNLADSNLNGTLPIELGLLSNSLVQLDVRNNHNLMGTLPNIWSRDFRVLEELNIMGCSMEGSLPPEWNEMVALRTLDLGWNLLTGHLPEEWAVAPSMPFLTNLTLSYNFLSGTIPQVWSNFSSLDRLYLSNNELIGTVPADLEIILTEFDIEGNLLVTKDDNSTSISINI